MVKKYQKDINKYFEDVWSKGDDLKVEHVIMAPWVAKKLGLKTTKGFIEYWNERMKKIRRWVHND